MLKRQMLTSEKFLTDSELQALAFVFESWKDTPRDSRNITLLWLMVETGMRAGEALELTRDDLRPDTNTVFVRGNKGSNSRELPVSKVLFARLQSLVVGDPRLFPITYKRLHQIWNFYRPCPKKLHSLRHTFACNLYKKTLDIRLVQRALGHRWLSNTMIYVTFTYDLETLRKAMLG